MPIYRITRFEASQADAEMNAFYQSLVVAGFTLNPQTWVYERQPKK